MAKRRKVKWWVDGPLYEEKFYKQIVDSIHTCDGFLHAQINCEAEFKIDISDPAFDPKELVEIYLNTESAEECISLMTAKYGPATYF